MQVKKFEAPTLQEALETIKRELGPEAIILQTKQYKRGFGLMSKGSVEVTAAVSERALHKKSFAETKIPEQSRGAVKRMPAERQAALYDDYADKAQQQRARREAASAASTAARVSAQTLGQAHAQISADNAGSSKRITSTPYIDIDSKNVPAPREQVAGPRAPAGAVAGNLNSSALKMSLEEEVKHLKRMIEEMKSAQDSELGGGAQALLSQSALNNPVFQDAFDQLVVNGLDKRFALSLIKKAAYELGAERAADPESVLDQLAAEIMQTTEVSSPLSGVDSRAQRGTEEGQTSQQGPAVIALVGPTGVGKTTTVAKIASEAILRKNLKVGLINIDSYKVAAFDQLGTYAKILNVPFRSVSSNEDLAIAIQDFQNLDLILIDTTGRSQRDPASLNEMHATLSSIPGVRSQLVLSATTRDTELYDMAARFAIFRPQGVIISKLDEATIYGAIYNVSHKVKLPLLYFTTGQRVPEDIEEATRERVAALVLDI